jgi:hypothetical protein
MARPGSPHSDHRISQVFTARSKGLHRPCCLTLAVLGERPTRTGEPPDELLLRAKERNMRKRAHSEVIKAAAFAAGLGIGLVSCPVFAAPASSGETVQGLYDTLLNMMKNARAGPKRQVHTIGPGH